MNNIFEGYLFVHFTDEQNDGEQIYFSISEDGLHWNDLNNGNPVLLSCIGEKGARDPFIIRAHNENKFYIIATDLRIANNKGWDVAQYNGSRSILIWESTDLINWTDARLTEVGLTEAGCVWAPEAIYIEGTDNYLVFWASMVKEKGESDAKQRIYYSITKDFIHFSQPVKYIESENHIIDTTIIKDGYYYRISKDETTKNIKIDKGLDIINGPFFSVHAPELEQILGVEGPAAFQFNGSNSWCLMVDQFGKGAGYMPLITDDLSGGVFKLVPEENYDMGKTKKRHGSILNISQNERKLLIEKFGVKS